ncbi:MAG TPA: MaoC/PaaZ C-terminal domain-containing protein [Bryobacteraceae bacterium]|nr:MaoC/PaaZ C-terminal domain-containing protein [Bryobacteraceae bacterium]
MTKYFDYFRIGEVHESGGRTITETDIVNFAGLSGDFSALHMDEEFAKTTPFGRRIAHGTLVFSISIGLVTQMNLVGESLIAFYGVEKLRFTKPVFIGDTVRVTKKVSELLERGAGRGVVTFATTVLNQRNEPVLVYSDKLVVKRRV